MRLHGKTDSNQTEIVEALRATGHTVRSLSSIGSGLPDIIVGRNGVNVLLEIKDGAGKLTSEQAVFHNEWKGQVAIARTVEEAMEAINQAVRRG
jgi:hypothetical protein